jgi:molecular chaperone DnaK (HSP70)
MNRKVSNKIIGIDLGTTNSCVAVFQREGVKVIPNNDEGNNTTPSAVSFDSNGEKETVGGPAKRQASIKPGRVIFEAKRLIGRKFNSKEVQDFCQVSPFKVFEKKDKNGAA